MPATMRIGSIWLGMISGLFPWLFVTKFNRKSYFYLATAFTFGPALFIYFALLAVSSTYSEHGDVSLMSKVLAFTIVIGTSYFILRISRAKKHLKKTANALLGSINENQGVLYFAERSSKTEKSRYTLDPNWIITILGLIGSTFAANMGQQNMSTPNFVSTAFVFLTYSSCYYISMVSSLFSYLYFEFLVFRELERIKNRPIYFEDSLLELHSRPNTSQHLNE